MKVFQAYAEVDDDNNALIFAFEWPGACGWGPKSIALAELKKDIIWTKKWLNKNQEDSFRLEITEEVKSTGDPKNADSEGFFEYDKLAFSNDEVINTLGLLQLIKIYIRNAMDQIPLNKRAIPLLAEKRTPNEVIDHIAIAEWWYMSRLPIVKTVVRDWRQLATDPAAKLNQVQDLTVTFLRDLLLLDPASRKTICTANGEKWSYRKVLRRMIWHELLHAKQLSILASELKIE